MEPPPTKRLKRSNGAAGSSNPSATISTNLNPRPGHPDRASDTRRHPYSHNLLAHHGCVNALAFSSPDGRWLVSGGDDKRVLLWDTFGDLTVAQPSAAYTGPRANIFSCAVSCDGRRILSGGLCDTLFQWDLERPGAPVRVDRHHVASIRGVTCHPTEPTVSLAASEDGTISCCDSRSASGPRAILSERAEYVDVIFSPTSDNLFAAATSSSIQLYDRRRVSLLTDPSEHSVQKYVSSMVRGRALEVGRPEVSSLAFDPSGRYLSAMMSRWYPTIWAVAEPSPIAVLRTPGDHGRGFRDTITVKHGAFSFPKHSERLCFAAGSEDFTTYVWELPPGLEDDRREVGFESWQMSDTVCRDVAHCASSTGVRSIPTTLASPAYRLYGHRSIPNSAAFHPTLPLVFTAGVEKTVKVHSSHPFGEDGAGSAPTPKTVRGLAPAGPMPSITRFGHFGDSISDSDSDSDGNGGAGGHLPSGTRARTEEQRRAEDLRTLRMFDQMLEEEGWRGLAYEDMVWLANDDDEDTDLEDDASSDVVHDH